MIVNDLYNIARVDKKTAERYLPFLNKFMPIYEINTRLRKSAFLAQLLHESGRFLYTEEIASGEAYEGRKDLGNTKPGDGVRFKGRGLIQLTGRANYTAISKELGVNFVLFPEKLELPEYATQSACWFWKSKGLNQVADRPENWTIRVKVGSKEVTYTKFQYITRRVNGGLNGYAERLKYHNDALKFL